MTTHRRDHLRLLTMGLSASAVGGHLAGCDRPASSSRQDQGQASLWFCYGGKNREVLLDLVAQFHAAQARYRIVPVYQGDYFEGLAKLRTSIYAGTPPALTHVVAEVVPYLEGAGALEDLAPRFQQEMTDLLPSLAQSGTWVGGAHRPLVALPFNRSTPIAYFNRELFDSRGLQPPTTWDELRQVARELTDRAHGDVRRFGFQVPVDWWFWTALLQQAGGELVDREGRVTLGGEAGVSALRFLQQLVHEDGSMKAPPGRDYNSWQACNTDFLAGRTAMIWTSTAFLRYLEDNARFPVGAAPLPRAARYAVPTGGTFFVRPRGAPRETLDAVTAFLKFMMAPAQANSWASRTGYLPVSGSGLRQLEASGYYSAHPNDRVALEQLAHAQPWPWAPTLFRLQREIVQPRLEAAVLLRQEAAQVLREGLAMALRP